VVYVDRPLGTSRRSFGDDPVMRRLGEELRRRTPRATEVARLDAQELVVVIPGRSAGLVDPVAVVNDVTQRLGAEAGLDLHPEEIACCPLVPTTVGGLLGQVRRVPTRLLVGGGTAPTPVVPRGPSADDIDRVLERSEFRLAYQPVLDAAGAVVAIEALLRWESPDGGLLLPGAFLPAVEREGMDVEVGTWVLRRALHDAVVWDADALVGVPVVVNVSAAQLGSPGLLAVLPFVDTVKLDRSVVADLHGSGRATAAALRILAQRAGVRLGATGVETGDQLAALRELGVEYVQGYRFCPPVQVGELAARTAPLGVPASH